MANYNKVILAGNMTRDPQLRFLPSQTAVADFGLAINRKWRTPEGQQREEVCFVDCTAFGKQAETLNQYTKKGSPILIEGRLKLDTWEKDGQKHSKLKVVIDGFQFLGAPSGQGQGQGGAPRQAAARPAYQPAAQAPSPDEAPPIPAGASSEPAPPEFNGNSGSGEDIPF